jgi:hypothetical protein
MYRRNVRSHDVHIGDHVLIDGCNDWIKVTAILPGVIFWRADGKADFSGGMWAWDTAIYAHAKQQEDRQEWQELQDDISYEMSFDR